jgi:protein gp37
MPSKTTKIEWTDKTWNPITGCTKRSAGCAHCYAEVMARRLKAMGLEKYRNGFGLTLHEEDLEEPLQWKKPHNIFVCSMSDIFHEEVPFEFVDRIMDTIHRSPQHRYQILTKRAERMAKYFSTRLVPSNVWLGVTVECHAAKMRIDCLQKVNAGIKFLSCEPLIEDLGEMDLRGIDWIIVGGESGPKARPMLLEWVVNIKQQVEQHGAAFFFKQWGTWGSDGIKRNKHANGKLLLGEVIQQMPERMAV